MFLQAGDQSVITDIQVFFEKGGTKLIRQK